MNVKMKSHEEGVSPVVGVMLMLVVTIIIAAVVSAFSGGLSAGQSKTSGAIILADYSQNGVLTIEHQGGDTLATINTKFVVRLAPTFGNSGCFAWEIDKKWLSTNSSANSGDSTCWLTSAGKTGVSAFGPGDIVYVPHAGMNNLQANLGSTSSNRLNNTANIGKTFYLEAYDNSGTMISKTEVTVNP